MGYNDIKINCNIIKKCVYGVYMSINNADYNTAIINLKNFADE